MQLAGKMVVVVGGSSGIGLATAELAKKEGAEVVIASRNAEKINAASSRLGAKGIQTDVTSDESVATLPNAPARVNAIRSRRCLELPSDQAVDRIWPAAAQRDGEHHDAEEQYIFIAAGADREALDPVSGEQCDQ